MHIVSRLSIARAILAEEFGLDTNLSARAGPLFYENKSNLAMAQVILSIPQPELIKHKEALEQIARLIQADGYLASRQAPSLWAESLHREFGLIPVDVLANGVGESFGLLKHTFGQPITDAEVCDFGIALLEAREQGAEMAHNAWLKNTMTCRAYALTSLLYHEFIGGISTLRMIRKGTLIVSTLDELINKGLLRNSMQLDQVWSIISQN